MSAGSFAVGECAVDDVGLGKERHRIGGHVGHGGDRPLAPPGHAAKDGRHLLEDGVGFLPGL
jgi:hypothetical protein